MAKERLDYLSYLLRLWQVRSTEGTVWRASVESPHTGERVGFGSLGELFTFLQRQTRHLSDSVEDEGGNYVSSQ